MARRDSVALRSLCVDGFIVSCALDFRVRVLLSKPDVKTAEKSRKYEPYEFIIELSSSLE